MTRRYRYGFTLVELSIVILIIGILVAGITGGAQLIAQAELRGVISDMTRFNVAMKEFKLQYDALAGDFRNADTFFTGCAQTNTFCGGNGDGQVQRFANGVDTGLHTGDEMVRVFRHLYLSGVIPDAGTRQLTDTINTSNIYGAQGYYPKSKLSGASIVIHSTIDTAICHDGVSYFHSPWTAAERVTAAWLVETHDSNVSSDACGGGITPAKAYQVDKKIDDASEASGAITGANTGVVRAIDSRTGACISGAAYQVTSTSNTCMLGLNLK